MGLFLSVTELLRFSQLYLQEGMWNGKQILTKEWVRESTAKQVDRPDNENGYGYLFCRGPFNTYYCAGKYGQYGMVIPEKNAVIAVNAEFHGKDEILENIYKSIVSVL
jgi:CubicO group peptidase (beta-lactamase class C family)